MQAIRVHAYHQPATLDDVAEPKLTGPLDVLVEVGGSGLCRTDLHILEGQWAEKSGVELPYTIGHENAGWVREIGAGVTNLRGGRSRDLPPARHLRCVPAVSSGRRHAL